jgi:hypothetical protein
MAQIRLLATLLLVVLSGIEIVYALLWAPLVGGALWADGSELALVGQGRGLMGLLLVLSMGWGVALLTTLAAAGIGTGHKIGWWMGVAASTAWLLTGCAPLALVALGVLMLPDVREQAFPPPPEGG